jgi:peptidylprolyl isomerase
MTINQPSRASRAAPFALWGAMLTGAALLGGAVTAIAMRSSSSGVLAMPTGEDSRAGAADPFELGPAVLTRLVGALPPAQRDRVLAEPDLFRRVVAEERARGALLDAARGSGLVAGERVGWLAARAADQVVLNTFVATRLAGALGEGFPDEARVRAFFEANRERYTLPERLGVSQIFLRLAADAPDAVRRTVEARATELVVALRAGEVGFEAAALGNSAHAASRINGGFMGVLPLSELRPELRQGILDLEPGRISDPMRGEGGLHIVRRGAVMPGGAPAYEAIRGRVRADLRQAAELEVRRRLAEDAAASHEAMPEPAVLEQWRQAVLSRLAGATP